MYSVGQAVHVSHQLLDACAGGGNAFHFLQQIVPAGVAGPGELVVFVVVALGRQVDGQAMGSFVAAVGFFVGRIVYDQPAGQRGPQAGPVLRAILIWAQ